MRIFVIALMLVGLGACAQLDAKVNMDLTGVTAIAQASGDTMLVACVGKLQPILQAKMAAASPDVLTKAAFLYEVRKVFGAEGECQGVTAEIASRVLMATPFVGPLL